MALSELATLTLALAMLMSFQFLNPTAFSRHRASAHAVVPFDQNLSLSPPTLAGSLPPNLLGHLL